MEKTITFGIPCYNSSAYMDHCIESILEGTEYAEDVEIIIVDDGSAKDDTPEKADAWAERHPTIIRAIHQENGGHGAAVMKALSTMCVTGGNWASTWCAPVRFRRLTSGSVPPLRVVFWKLAMSKWRVCVSVGRIA